ncbi:DUF1302 domain-containing protein [Beijerinckia indica]|uniref:DUF1302 domain-containing protein n=1 Tax=Beijerinckia indica subsp. indica (strain ATCC 9039 / DSM 1715 / NCIMB 8712) TaxID=395963 RepID=B2IIW5_BEII9|nr:DUF1302 domain-containing protein [Beijerinckia indica]ACB96177.1 protein of unknown function DUF1302 [Beijerinckia indica subsp. indica ATCC 9039]
MNDLRRKKIVLSCILFLSTTIVAEKNVLSADYSLGELNLAVHGVITFGTAIRTSNPDPSLSVTTTGLPGGNDGDVNFKKGAPVSTVLKAVGAVDFQYKNYGIFAKAKTWEDLTLDNVGVPYGHSPNGYVPNALLNDNGFQSLARFSGVSFQELFAYGKFDLSGLPLSVRAGIQTINWGMPSAFAGGLSNTVNAFDAADYHRPGLSPEAAVQPAPSALRPDFLPNTTTIPTPGLFARLDVTPAMRLEAFWQWAFVHNVIDPCGTFYSSSNFIAQGCNVIALGTAPGPTNYPSSISAGRTIYRENVPSVHDAGAFGIGGIYRLALSPTEIGIYFTHTDWRTVMPSAVTSLRPSGSAPFIPYNPDGKNPAYFSDYAKGIDTLTANFRSKLNTGTSFFGETTFRFNQPLAFNAADLLAAVTSNTSLTPLRSLAQTWQPGTFVHGYDEYRTLQVNLGVQQMFSDVLGANSLTLTGEGTMKHVFDLPSVNVRRYGRPDMFGVGPVNGVCPASTTGVGCINEGYVTPTAWGVAARAAFTYANIFGSDFDVIPSVIYRYDWRGYSYDQVLNQGRQAAIASVRLDYKHKLYLEASYSPSWGGTYNVLRDRSVATVSVGWIF